MIRDLSVRFWPFAEQPGSHLGCYGDISIIYGIVYFLCLCWLDWFGFSPALYTM